MDRMDWERRIGLWGKHGIMIGQNMSINDFDKILWTTLETENKMIKYGNMQRARLVVVIMNCGMS